MTKLSDHKVAAVALCAGSVLIGLCIGGMVTNWDKAADWVGAASGWFAGAVALLIGRTTIFAMIADGLERRTSQLLQAQEKLKERGPLEELVRFKLVNQHLNDARIVKSIYPGDPYTGFDAARDEATALIQSIRNTLEYLPAYQHEYLRLQNDREACLAALAALEGSVIAIQLRTPLSVMSVDQRRLIEPDKLARCFALDLQQRLATVGRQMIDDELKQLFKAGDNLNNAISQRMEDLSARLNRSW